MISIEERVALRQKDSAEEDRAFWKKIAKNMDAMTAIRADLKEAGYSDEVSRNICTSIVKDGNANPNLDGVKLPVFLQNVSPKGHRIGYVKGGNAQQKAEGFNSDKNVYLSNDLKTFEAKEDSSLSKERTR